MNLFGHEELESVPYFAMGARLSEDIGKIYRYSLFRQWEPSVDKHCLFVMLNPSTADGDKDDPTIRRCVGFARRFGFGAVQIANLFAYRATDPKIVFGLYRFNIDPVGPENKHWVQEQASNAGLIICAWGENGKHQGKIMKEWLSGYKLHALKFTKSGQPYHPLYLPADSKLLPYN